MFRIYFYNKLMLLPIIHTCILLIFATITQNHLIHQHNLDISEPDPYNTTKSIEYALYAGLAYCPKKCL